MGRKATVALICGALVLTLAMGIRQTFGLFLSPMSIDLGFGRESFGLAMAIQNILWGVMQPVTGMIADKYGAGRVLLAGTAAYVAGLVVMSGSTGVWGLQLGGGVLVGLAMSCTSFAVVLGAISRTVPAQKRSMALGIASAGGSFGQFIMAPIGQGLIAAEGWGEALVPYSPCRGCPCASCLAVCSLPANAHDLDGGYLWPCRLQADLANVFRAERRCSDVGGSEQD